MRHDTSKTKRVNGGITSARRIRAGCAPLSWNAIGANNSSCALPSGGRTAKKSGSALENVAIKRYGLETAESSWAKMATEVSGKAVECSIVAMSGYGIQSRRSWQDLGRRSRTSLNTVSSWRRSSVAPFDRKRTSTTSTASAMTTVLRILSFGLRISHLASAMARGGTAPPALVITNSNGS